ncbi:MAG: hypothetical protein DMD35_03930 [Gemmatimonadetes bacterium]|nr:MAG: hypothetical protein DMD35_03930 [Gemmatimonadota bacterium]
MEDARVPETEPSGALVPPPTHPPTALATAAPVPPRRWADDAIETRGLIARAVERTLDALDQVGDSIAAAVGLR